MQKQPVILHLTRVLSRNGFWGGKVARGKCVLDRGLRPSPQENVSLPLSKHIYVFANDYWQARAFSAINLNYSWEEILGGFGGKA